MSTYIKNNGINKEINRTYIKHDNVNKTIDSTYIKDNEVWKETTRAQTHMGYLVYQTSARVVKVDLEENTFTYVDLFSNHEHGFHRIGYDTYKKVLYSNSYGKTFLVQLDTMTKNYWYNDYVKPNDHMIVMNNNVVDHQVLINKNNLIYYNTTLISREYNTGLLLGKYNDHIYTLDTNGSLKKASVQTSNKSLNIVSSTEIGAWDSEFDPILFQDQIYYINNNELIVIDTTTMTEINRISLADKGDIRYLQCCRKYIYVSSYIDGKYVVYQLNPITMSTRNILENDLIISCCSGNGDILYYNNANSGGSVMSLDVSTFQKLDYSFYHKIWIRGTYTHGVGSNMIWLPEI
jgi:hypothetical protein